MISFQKVRASMLLVILGWKHYNIMSATYNVIEKQRQQLQIDRNTCLQDVTDAIADTYFPNGSSDTGTKLSMVDYYVAKADGTKLPDSIADDEFSLAKYRKTQNSPLKIYLYTMDKV